MKETREIFLSTKIVQNTDLSDGAIAVYTILRMLKYKECELIVDTNAISYNLFNNKNYDRLFVSKVSKALEELQENELITIKEKLTLSTYVLDLTNIHLDTRTEFFVKITQEEVNKLMNIKIINVKLLRYFIVLLSTINNKTKVGFDTQEALTFKTDINRDTICAYNKKLQELELIYTKSSKDFLHCKKDKTISKIANHYSRFEDSEICNKHLEEFAKSYGYNGTKKKKEEVKIAKEKAKEDKNLAIDELLNGLEDKVTITKEQETYKEQAKQTEEQKTARKSELANRYKQEQEEQPIVQQKPIPKPIIQQEVITQEVEEEDKVVITQPKQQEEEYIHYQQKEDDYKIENIIDDDGYELVEDYYINDQGEEVEYPPEEETETEEFRDTTSKKKNPKTNPSKIINRNLEDNTREFPMMTI